MLLGINLLLLVEVNVVRHKLTINPTKYTSCIEQFWATLKAKSVNGEVQLQALVDGKKIVITESIVRRDLQLEDIEGVDCLPNATIFKQLTLMGSKTIAWNEFSSIMASAIICLATNQKFNFSKYIFESMVKNLDNVVKILMYPRFVQVFVNQQLNGLPSHKRIYVTPSYTKKIFGNMRKDSGNIIKTRSKATPNEAGSQGTTLGGGPRRQETIRDTIAQTRSENVSEHSNDPLLARGNTLRSGEDRLKLEDLMALCTTLQSRVLALETTKTTQATGIASLKRRVKKLERRNKLRTHRLKRLYRVGSSRRTGEDMFGVNDLDGDEVIVESIDVVKTAEETRSVVEEVTDVTIPVKLKSAKPKAKKVVIQEPEQGTTTPTLATTTAATTIIAVNTRPRAKGLVIHEYEQAPTPTVCSQQPSLVV
ncbi:hypothetical protein Tco_0261965 [Tanacetum coccineum]